MRAHLSYHQGYNAGHQRQHSQTRLRTRILSEAAAARHGGHSLRQQQGMRAHSLSKPHILACAWTFPSSRDSARSAHLYMTARRIELALKWIRKPPATSKRIEGLICCCCVTYHHNPCYGSRRQLSPRGPHGRSIRLHPVRIRRCPAHICSSTSAQYRVSTSPKACHAFFPAASDPCCSNPISRRSSAGALRACGHRYSALRQAFLDVFYEAYQRQCPAGGLSAVSAPFLDAIHK